MEWLERIQKAIDFIENNITDSAELTSFEVANEVYSSEYNFRNIFKIATGNTLGEYIRNRRLSLAGEELVSTDIKILDLALKYGYDTAESFTKAFTRFHGTTPSTVRKTKKGLKSFSRIDLKIDTTGGTIQDYSIETYGEIYIAGYTKVFGESCFEKKIKHVPEFIIECCNNKFDELVSAQTDDIFKDCFLGYRRDVSGDLEFTFGSSCTPNYQDDELTVIKLEPSTWLKLKCNTRDPSSMKALWYRFYSEIMPIFSFKLIDNVALQVISIKNDVDKNYLLIPFRQN